MNLKELNEWIKSANYIEHGEGEFTDSCGNEETSIIYEKDGKYYKIEFQNGHPYEKWGGKGFIRGEYDLKEVKKISGMTYWHDWEYICLDTENEI